MKQYGPLSVCLLVCLFVCVCLFVYVCVCLYVCVPTSLLDFHLGGHKFMCVGAGPLGVHRFRFFLFSRGGNLGDYTVKVTVSL